MTVFYQTTYSSPIGDLSLLADEEGLLGVWFLEQRYFQRGYEEILALEEDNRHLIAARKWLDAYFKGENPSLLSLSLCPRGTAFQQRVWQLLQDIPYGETLTYGDIAQRLNCPSAQAVGGAVGKNPLSIMIPCHRVLGSRGHLTGYAGGLDRKNWLLAHEQSAI
ncbi:methylated-DNA--[protein]-cysteine S-methyltransferase [Streptococcus ferus]|uniref:methylated-DNA--[protein]-cysteine S-methyltransferase n=1 Tax=Streptococcus ferus TaxID=1345 RepID=UPI0035A0D113